LGDLTEITIYSTSSLQDIYNNLPFIEKTGDGKQLLQDVSLLDLRFSMQQYISPLRLSGRDSVLVRCTLYNNVSNFKTLNRQIATHLWE
jgi:hypothetical protein